MLKPTDLSAAALTCVSLKKARTLGQLRTHLGQAEDMSLRMLMLKVRLGFFVGFEFVFNAANC